MESLIKDIRYGIRGLLKHSGFTLIALITLALGIGANTAIFSMVNALLIKPLPFSNLDRIVALWDQVPSRGVEHNEVTVANVLDWRAQNQSFEQLAIYRWWSTNLTGGETPERLQGFQVTANFLDAVGVKPILGRSFAADEDQPGKDAVAILSYGLWQRRFGGDANIINKQITLNGVVRTVIGVLPAGSNYPKGYEILAPLPMRPNIVSNRGDHAYLAIGRLKQGVSIESAQRDLNAIAGRLAQQYPETNTGRGVSLYAIVEDTVRLYKTALLVLMFTVGFVLLIACANIANLMLARAAGRAREMALRATLGASRGRIVRQLLTESVILSVVGGAFGVLLAYWGVALLKALNPGDAAKFAPGWDHLGIDTAVLGFTLVVSVLCGLFFGLAPAWQSSKPDLNEALKEGGRQTASGSHRLRSLLVISEVTLSLMLLIGAGLLMRTFTALVKTNAGFSADNVMTMSLTLPAAKYREPAQNARFYDELVQRVSALAGVNSAAVVNHLPLGGSNSSAPFLIEGQPQPAPGQEFSGRFRVCTPDYFRTMGISLLQGRGFTNADKAGAPPVVIVNETLARRFWPNVDPIGKRMRFPGPLGENPWMPVVGVVQDVKHELNLPTTPDFYRPHAQDPWNSMVLVAHTKVDPLAMAAPMREQVWAIDREQPVFEVQSMTQVRSTSLALYSFSSVSLGIFAGVAVLLAAIGIYGVMSFAVTQRTHEIGIRMALGAQMGDVLKLVVKNGMMLALIGVTLGLAGAFVLTRFLTDLLFGVTPTDALTFVAVPVGLIAVALVACYMPARRATKVNPLVALRYE